MNTSKRKLIAFILSVSVLTGIISYFKLSLDIKTNKNNSSYLYYKELQADNYDEDPLEYIDENYNVKEGFSSNLPLVVISFDGELPDYKHFATDEDGESKEVIYDVNPWTTGKIALYQNSGHRNSLSDEPSLSSDISIKKRGHTSYSFDKSQYAIKLIDENGEENKQDVFGMGKDDEWILNGSMADKSMIRNYLAYNVSAHIMEYAPKCCYCEVLIQDGGKYIYQGVYLMMDSIKQSPERIDVEKCNTKNSYTSYVIRRDRYTQFDTMLETYARLNALNDQWIGIKYPSTNKQTSANIDYIQKDFSQIERVIYAKNDAEFRQYADYIDTDSFVDYFLINEFFGNYDAGEHSTYMYKNPGEPLKIGPVWDFDQAMNNSSVDEADPLTLAMQEKAFYKQLCRDTEFITKLKKRYAVLRKSYLSDRYIYGLIDETTKYLRSAKEREWYRWAADYCDDSGKRHGNYYLDPYTYRGEVIERFNSNYDQEIYNIKVYLGKHGAAIQTLLTGLVDNTEVTSGLKGEIEWILIMVCVLFFIPSILINRK